MSRNNRLTIYLIAAYLGSVVIASIVVTQGVGWDPAGIGLAALTLSVAFSGLLLLVGFILFLAGGRTDRTDEPNRLDAPTVPRTAHDDRVTAAAFFGSAGLILLIGGSLCLGSLSL